MSQEQVLDRRPFPARMRAAGSGLVSRHPELTVVMAVALLLRVAVELAYRPALTFSDSWVYLRMAYTGSPVGIVASRPSGYPLLLRVFSWPGKDMLEVTVLQHLAGIGVGVLVYALLMHFGLRRLLAVLAAAAVMLDAYTLTLEQFIMAEAFFTPLLMGALALTILRRDSAQALLVAGVLLAVACTVRTEALFVVPVWGIYLLLRARSRRRLVFACAGLALPLLLYGFWHAQNTGGSFNLDQSDGWFLYGRVAEFADCQGAHIPPGTSALCDVPIPIRREMSPGAWLWAPLSPAELLTGGNPDAYVGQRGGWARTARDNKLLQDFALAIMRRHPGRYASTALGDFSHFFDPRFAALDDADGVTVTFPASPLLGWLFKSERNRYLPSYVPHVRWPSAALREYQSLFPDPRLYLGVLCVAALLCLLAPLAGLQVARRAEVFLLTGSGLVMLVGSAALVSFVVRYLIPSLPLLISGGLLGVNELAVAVEARRRALRGGRGEETAVGEPHLPAWAHAERASAQPTSAASSSGAT